MISGLPPRGEFRAVEQSDDQQHCAPPYIGVQVKKNHMEIMLRASLYQKIMLSTKNTTTTTLAQKSGFWYRGTSPIEGIFVSPYTRPVNSLAGTGFVAILTTTVTITQTMKDQSA